MVGWGWPINTIMFVLDMWLDLLYLIYGWLGLAYKYHYVCTKHVVGFAVVGVGFLLYQHVCRPGN